MPSPVGSEAARGYRKESGGLFDPEWTEPAGEKVPSVHEADEVLVIFLWNNPHSLSSRLTPHPSLAKARATFSLWRRHF